MDSIFTNMFQIGLPLLLEKVLRTVLVYVALIIGLRLAGKRELAQLNPFDLVVLLTISNTVQNAIIGNDNSVSGGIIGVATLLVMNFVLGRLVYKNDKLEKIVVGTEALLIENGEIRQENLDHELINLTDLQVAAHKQGIHDLSMVETGLLEPDGAITFTLGEDLPEEKRHQELLDRLDALSREVAALRNKMENSQD
jgi:uncharacterized membrane protein YcaP (DUF421 family)